MPSLCSLFQLLFDLKKNKKRHLQLQSEGRNEAKKCIFIFIDPDRNLKQERRRSCFSIIKSFGYFSDVNSGGHGGHAETIRH